MKQLIRPLPKAIQSQNRITHSAQLHTHTIDSFVLALNNKKAKQSKFLGWDNYCKKMQLHSFEFSHIEMNNDVVAAQKLATEFLKIIQAKHTAA